MIKFGDISLRAIEPEDIDAYFNWINDDETNQWRGLYHPTSKEEANNWIESHRKHSPTSVNFAILDSEGRHIGFIGLQAICSRSRRAEIWIYIGEKSAWNKGYGEDSVRALCDYAFEEMNLHRIWLECNPEFTNVVKCYTKIGFKEEGRLRDAYYRNGQFRDTCIMALLRSDLEVKV